MTDPAIPAGAAVDVPQFSATYIAVVIRDVIATLDAATPAALGHLLRAVVAEAMRRGLDVPRLAGTDPEQIGETLRAAYASLDDETLASTVAGMIGELERREHARREASRDDGHDEPPPETQPSPVPCAQCHGWGHMLRDGWGLHPLRAEPVPGQKTEPCPTCGIRGQK